MALQYLLVSIVLYDCTAFLILALRRAAYEDTVVNYAFLLKNVTLMYLSMNTIIPVRLRDMIVFLTNINSTVRSKYYPSRAHFISFAFIVSFFSSIFTFVVHISVECKLVCSLLRFYELHSVTHFVGVWVNATNRLLCLLPLLRS